MIYYWIFTFSRSESIKNIELQVNDEKRYKWPFELERIDVYDSGGFWLVNERFKQFAQKEHLTFSFYPTLLKWERRYIMMFDGLPQIYDLHKIDDVTVTSYPAKIFRSDILEYLWYEMFTSEVNITLYVTENMKEKLEKEKFKVYFIEEKIEQIPLDRVKLEKEIPEIEREWISHLQEVNLPARRKKQTDIIDEYLKEHPHFTQEQYFEEVKN